MAKQKRPASKTAANTPKAESYRHPESDSPLRPDIGTQPQFKKKKPPATYRYDSSLSPSLDWDGQNGSRDLAEFLLSCIKDAAGLAAPHLFDSPRELKLNDGTTRATVRGLEDAVEQLTALGKPFLNWAGKAERLSFDVPTLPLFVHERLSTAAIIDTLKSHRKPADVQFDLFGDPQHDISDQVLRAYEYRDKWVNRMILGDSLVVMSSLLHYEGLAGQVQTIYMDPPYGVKFGSNFQPFVRRRDVKHNDDDDMTREPEMVKAYRDTWELGLHSYLTYMRDRLLLARELLTPSGSIFVQISDENLHHVRELMDEVFGGENSISVVPFRKKTMPLGAANLESVTDYLLWFAKSKKHLKFRPLFDKLTAEGDSHWNYLELADGSRRKMARDEIENHRLLPPGSTPCQLVSLYPAGLNATGLFPFSFGGVEYTPPPGNSWFTNLEGMKKLALANRLMPYEDGQTLRYVLKLSDSPVASLTNLWADTSAPSDKVYVVQTNTKVVQRCILLTTDPGDLVLDPTCGSGTSAHVAEQWGRRWVTIDTSRVPLALARQRLLTATYNWYMLKEEARGPISGFVYKRRQNKKGEEVGGVVPYISKGSIANDEPVGEDVRYDMPEVASGIVRVSGPFTVEATIPTPVDWEGDGVEDSGPAEAESHGSFVERMLEVLRRSPVLHVGGGKTVTLRNVRIPAKTLTLSAEAQVDATAEGQRPSLSDALEEATEKNKRELALALTAVSIVFGPENGSISEKLVYEAAKESAAKSYTHLYVIGFAIQPNARKLVETSDQAIGVAATYVQATPDLMMGDLLKNMRSSQIFSVCGLPDIDLKQAGDAKPGKELRYVVSLKGLDVFDPSTMETIPLKGEDVPAWFLDTDYNGLSFHVCQAFFPRTSAWESLKKALKATYSESVWDHLAGTKSAPFEGGEHGQVAVKVIDDRGNELIVVKMLTEARALMDYEVDQPILNSPYKEPAEYWQIMEGETPKRMPGRRRAMYYYRAPSSSSDDAGGRGSAVELALVNLIRDRLADWRKADYAGVSRTTLELLRYWQRDGRGFRLFFAQVEAVETIIFLVEARADLRQGIEIPRDEPGPDGIEKGYSSFVRYACKMATGSGKTVVMGMLAAWSILNKVTSRTDNRFSDTVLAVCPNVTIRNRLQELDPGRGEASIYRTKDLVPSHLMADLSRGRLVVTNWHVFEPQVAQVGGVSARVSKAGVAVQSRETISIGTKTGTSRGTRYLTEAELARQMAAGLIEVREEIRDAQGVLKKVVVDSIRYVESDAVVVSRVLGRQVGGKKNILVFNDEAHHAYRIRREEDEEQDDDEEETADFFQEATVWIEGLDRINKLRGINLCVDLSATPYYLGRVGQKVNQTFPWVVSDFGLTDAIESGLVKIPQLAVRDSTGADIPGYFNIWRFIWEKLTPAERGGAHASPRPEAILKWANHPITMLASHWDELRKEWDGRKDDPRPPVFILVCKNTRIAKVIYEWMAEDNGPPGIPKCGIAAFRNSDDRTNTIRVDSRVVQETDSAEAKSDESAWMRLTLDTVGKMSWPEDRQGRKLYPEGFEALAKKLGRPVHPPGREVRCIVSVGMLTEGWDCNTVTHIIGLRPFMSQLLCEQVVGRGLRRASYQVGENDLLTEEVSKVFGVPFEVIPFKASPDGNPPPPVKRAHVHALPGKAQYEITFPRVTGYRQAVRSRVTVNWVDIASVTLDPLKIPAEVEVKAVLPNNKGRPSLQGPGKLESLDLAKYREGKRVQELSFQLARDLTRDYMAQGGVHPPAHVLFPQVAAIVARYLREKVTANPPADILDIFLSPYYGWVIERLKEAIKPDAGSGEEPELPVLEANRGPGSTADVDFWTSRDVREVLKSHVNFVVADTAVWEQAAAYVIDRHRGVTAFAKNAGLGFSIPYLHNDKQHEYVPDFIIRLSNGADRYLILETKGFDPLADIKAQAAERWVNAVNADGGFGTWSYAMARKVAEVAELITKVSTSSGGPDRGVEQCEKRCQ